MREITAYQTSDGKLFTDDREANCHQAGIIGELLDTLLPHDTRGNVTRADRYNLLMGMLHSEDLKKVINSLHYAINFSDETSAR